MYTLVYSHRKNQNHRKVLTWKPGILEVLANKPNHFDVIDAKNRVKISVGGKYVYTPSKAYLKFISKFKKGNIHGNLWGNLF